MKHLITALSVTLCILCYSQTTEIKGTIRDKETSIPLPYATISVENTGIGTIANPTGGYSIIVPDSISNAKIQVSYLGYYSKSIDISEAKNTKLNIELKPYKHEIKEVIIRPLTPQEVIRRMLANRLQNYPTSPFFVKGFYRETFTENQQYLDFVEALVAVHNFGYNDTTKSEAYLIQGRTRDDLQEMNFGSHMVEKKYEKEIKKAERKGEPTDSIEKDQAINIIFGGPAGIIFNDPVRYPADGLDTNEFKHYQYEFGEDSYLDGKELYTIKYVSKRRQMGAKISGTLYITKDTYAMVHTNTMMDIQVPAFAKPLLAAVRVKANDIELAVKVEYKAYRNQYYISKVVKQAQGHLTKKYMGHPTEDAKFYIQQAFAVTDINPLIDTTGLAKVQTSSPLREQLKGYDEAFWEVNNKIKYD